MNSKNIIAIIIIIVVLIGGGIWISRSHNAGTDYGNTTGNTTGTTTDSIGGTATSTATSTKPIIPPVATSYSLAVVATHNSGASCWTTINGKVYDVTSWINQHPGGAQAILSLCGKDGSSAFNGQHGGQARPEQELATFYIGTLK